MDVHRFVTVDWTEDLWKIQRSQDRTHDVICFWSNETRLKPVDQLPRPWFQTWYLWLILLVEKIVMWRNFSFPCMTIVGKLKISPHVEKFQMSPHDRCGEIWNSPHMACVWCRKRCHICKIYAIYAVLLLNLLFTLFCREIFATIYALSCGEKLSPKVHLWRKNDKYQVWLPSLSWSSSS